MAFRTSHLWTFWGLVGAFVDLALAYFLLCGSAFAYFAWKICNLFGLILPCPCTGFFGDQNSNICLHRLLIDWPVRKICSVQMLIKSNFPFHLIWFEEQPCNLEMVWCRDRNYDNGVLELENEASSSSFSSPKLRTLVDRESGFDAKGKKIVNQKPKNGIRRKRRSSLGHGKSSAGVVVAGSSGAPYNKSDMSNQIGDCLSPIHGKEDVLQDYRNAAVGLDLGERTWHNFEQDVPFMTSEVKDNDSSSVDKFVCSAQNKSKNAGNEENIIRILKEALEEEKAACIALQLELEKERAAAATAADEAIAMILRLQADKASIEMEARQYQRMIEEKFEYEEEEMNIMKEILVRRERENHFLQKEVEAYRQMKSFGNWQSEVDFSFLTSECGQKPLPSLDSNEYLLEFEKGKLFDKNKVEKAANLLSGYEASSAEITSEASQTFHGNKKILSCSGEKLEKVEESETKVCNNLQCPKFDSEPVVYDVHVVDDKTELIKEENGKEGLSNCVAADSGGTRIEVLSDRTSARVVETNQSTHDSFKMKDGISVLDDSQSKTLPSDLDRNSSSASSIERSKIDIEVELLRERLRIVREGKEKLTFSADHKEIIDAQLKLVEEIMNHLELLQQLRGPTRQASLPPSSSKSKVGLNLRKRRCRSVPSEANESS